MVSILSPPAPQLPQFQTLLIRGDYPASAPFHLCLSHSSRPGHVVKSRPIFITARNQAGLIKNLVDLNDDWLVNNAGRGTTAGVLSQIQIFYPASPDHWSLLFSLLRTDGPRELGSASTNLGQPVSLVVLHEPSAFFLDNDSPKSFTMSSYLRLITCALTSLRSLNTEAGPPPLALFDSRLEELSLPILPVGITDPIVEDAETDSRPGCRPTKVVVAVERYFELIGRVEVGDETVGNDRQHVMLLAASEYSKRSLPSPVTWRWRQVRVEESVGSPRTVFHWDET